MSDSLVALAAGAVLGVVLVLSVASAFVVVSLKRLNDTMEQAALSARFAANTAGLIGTYIKELGTQTSAHTDMVCDVGLKIEALGGVLEEQLRQIDLNTRPRSV